MRADLFSKDGLTARRGFFSGLLVGMPSMSGVLRLLTASGIHQQLLAADVYSQRLPMLTELPPGYRLTWAYHDRPDGFHGGPVEVAFFYINPQFVTSLTNPIALFVAPKTTNQFAMTEDHDYESVKLQTAKVEAVARYFDGAWMLSPEGEAVRTGGKRVTWDRSNFHSIVFDFDVYSIGIRACRNGSVFRDTLITTAQSLQ